MRYLRARVYDLERKRAESERLQLRLTANSTGDRSDKIRTYNFPQVSGGESECVYVYDISRACA